MNIKKELQKLFKNTEKGQLNPMKHPLLIFYTCTIIWLELVYRLWSLNSLNRDFIFSILFSLAAGGFLYLCSSLFASKAVNRAVTIFVTVLLGLIYNVQLVYYSIFQAPFSFYSLTGAGDVTQFMDVILSSIAANLLGIVLIFLPMLLLITGIVNITPARIKTPVTYYVLIFVILSHIISIICVNLTGDSIASQKTLYYKTFAPQLSISKLGLLTTMRLDLQRLVIGEEGEAAIEALNEESAAVDLPQDEDKHGEAYEDAEEQTVVTEADNAVEEAVAEPVEEAAPVERPFNVMDIDFDSLIAGEKNQVLLEMHKYFASVSPTRQNEYTGLFKGCNLILVTAESFSPYAIDPELTPTLYKMVKEGFEFTNFYNPVWGVSTTDGEYTVCTGLMPKAGVWSFARSARNYMPFALGNQFQSLGYITKAWHNHSYTYYRRHLSHPNMGYEYKGVGNGLEISKTWPESDLEMIEVTTPEYIGTQPFHTYYMTVSGHLQYNFEGNYIARKNKKYVEELPYSTPSKAYLACNLELEFAMRTLVERLEEAGIAENTVIAISPDHYPYGLRKENIDELAGHKVESNFELYKSVLIIWKKGMEHVVVDKPCSSIDINPTLSNLFGLEYDSRLMMGRDIFSDEPPVVIFANMSWITDRARYNSVNDRVEFTDGTERDDEYVEKIHKLVEDRYKYSAKILENDYYRKVLKPAIK